MTPVRVEPGALRSRVKHSTTEPLRSLSGRLRQVLLYIVLPMFAVCHEHQFKDKYLFYRFREDDQGVSTVPSSVSKKECEDDLQEVFLMLAQIGPDAMMRMILRKV